MLCIPLHHLSNRPHTLRSVERRFVDHLSNSVADHQLERQWSEQLHQLIWGGLRIKPRMVIVTLEDHRHTGMRHLDHRVGRRGDQGTRFQLVLPAIPVTREGERTAVFESEVVGDLGWAGCPFIETIGRHQAPHVAERAPIGVARRHRLAPGFNFGELDGGLFGPRGDEPPLANLYGVRRDPRHGLRRGDVEPAHPGYRDAEKLAKVIVELVERVAAPHGQFLINKAGDDFIEPPLK